MATKWEATLKEYIESRVRDAFAQAGETLAEGARARLAMDGRNASGEASDSIGWATSEGVHQISNKYPIGKPTSPMVLRIGIGVPYANEIMYGVAPSPDPLRAADIMAWAEQKGIRGKAARRITKSIMEEGTILWRAVQSGEGPYVFMPTKSEATKVLSHYMRNTKARLAAEIGTRKRILVKVKP